MDRNSRKRVVDGSQRLDADTIEREIRERIRATIEVIVEEELEAMRGETRLLYLGFPSSGEARPTRWKDRDPNEGKQMNSISISPLH